MILTKDKIRRWQRALPFIVAGIIISIIAAMTITLWAQDSSQVDDFAPEEAIIDYLAGYNFVTHGFLERGLLTDHSLDFQPSHPPVYYTHQPPLPIIIIGALNYLGVDTLPEVRLVMIIIFLLGLVAVLAFFWRLLTPWHGIAVVGLLALNGYHVLPLADHTTHVYWLGLSFLALWAVSRASDRPRFIWLAAVAVLAISLINYIQLLVLIVTIFGLFVVRIPGFTLKRFLILLGFAFGGVFIHIIQNVIVLGPGVAWEDIISSVGNRVFGEPTREFLRSFSQENNLILWGVHSVGNSSNPFASLWTQLSPLIVAILVPLGGLGFFAVLKKKISSILALRLLAAFFFAALAFYLVLPAAAAAYPLPLVIATPAAMAGGLFIGEIIAMASLFTIPQKTWRILLKRGSLVVLVVLFACITIWQTIAGTWPTMLRDRIHNNDFAATELLVLKDFKGEVFWTNITPHQVAYYTQSPVIGQISFEAFKKHDISEAYVIPVNNQSPEWARVNNPRYFFFGMHHVQPDTAEDLEAFGKYLAANYPVIAWSENRYPLIVDISAGPVGTSRIIRGETMSSESKFPSIELDSSMITVSSAISQDNSGGALVQSGMNGFWHLSIPRAENPAWVEITLPTAAAIAELQILPRIREVGQMWDGNRAVFQGSRDGITWESLGVLGIDRNYLYDGWISFPVFSTVAYQYYRLEFYDMSFLSMARLAMTKVPSIAENQPSSPPLIINPTVQVIHGSQGFSLQGYVKLPLTPEQLEVSSINNPTQGKDNLVNDGVEGYWHVKSPREENPAWLTIDLHEAYSVSLLRILPRAGVPQNLWDGAKAVWEFSDNGTNWSKQATLSLARSTVIDDWISFLLPKPEEHRYYRLSISDMSFFSFARLELYSDE